MPYDCIIRGGLIYDGTGRTPYVADIGIADGLICEIGKLANEGVRVVDADGASVTPGFIDLHTHYDGQVSWSNRLTPSTYHGVTTAILGNCGVGFAPVRSGAWETLIELMEGVEDIPEIVLISGIERGWESFEEYIEFLALRHYDVDFGVQIPHGALRLYVMGERAMRLEIASAEDRQVMADLVARGLRAGAVGFSTSRTLNHKTATGEPMPSLCADLEELGAIADAIKMVGTGVMQFISDFSPSVRVEYELIEEVVRRSGSKGTISLSQRRESPNKWRELLDLMTVSERHGIDIRAQIAPRAIGILFGVDTSRGPLHNSVTFNGLQHYPLEKRVEILKDVAVRGRILAEVLESGGWCDPTRHNEPIDYNRVYELGDPPNYEPGGAMCLAARAKDLGTSPLAVAYDSILKHGGRGLLMMPFSNYSDGNLDVVREMLVHERSLIGLGDGGAHVGMICDASFPTFLLSYWGRDRSSGTIAKEQLIRKLTSDNARAVGLADRGSITIGQRADINILDFDAIRARAPRIVYDLPGGGARFVQTANGYLSTLVNGVVTYVNGIATEELPGRIIRKH